MELREGEAHRLRAKDDNTLQNTLCGTKVLIDPGTRAAAGPSIFCLPGLCPKIRNLTYITVIFPVVFYGCEKRDEGRG